MFESGEHFYYYCRKVLAERIESDKCLLSFMKQKSYFQKRLGKLRLICQLILLLAEIRSFSGKEKEEEYVKAGVG